MGLPKEFASAFDPKSEKHVLWLKNVCETMNSEGPVDEIVLQNVWLKNVLDIKITPKELLSCAEVHFVLCMKYAAAVLKSNAWIPPTSSPSDA